MYTIFKAMAVKKIPAMLGFCQSSIDFHIEAIILKLAIVLT
ncbi:hypothetical protein PTUN_a1078 [Pseudoalteromonas tunicata]|nr:hypothetical protein PTUN_a1078 [Pseudoalteromonas tunicata]